MHCQIFDKIDRNGSGKISVDELKEGLERLGISVSRPEAEAVSQRFASHGGSIRFRDFVR
jgi:Ca2+-binding EF-hand superfamily protein